MSAYPSAPIVTGAAKAVAFRVEGMSFATRDRNAGVSAPPDVGPAHTELAGSVLSVAVSVPLPVTGDPEIAKTDKGRESPTLVTVPPNTEQTHAPLDHDKTYPFVEHVVKPVPPLAAPTTPVTFPAVPVVF